MSQGNIWYEMKEGKPFPRPSTTVVPILRVADATYGELIMMAYGTSVPTDATSGYAVGCIFVHTDGGNDTALYVNEGTAASCDFNAIQGA